MFSNTSRSITREDIEKIELNLGIKFPNNFIDHYLAYNGGVPSAPFFYSEETGIEVEIQIFSPIKYGFNDFDIKTVEEKYIFFREKAELLADYLPFANDYGSNQICINLKNNKIYICYMDMGEINLKCFKFLASDFTEFLSGLSEESIDD